MKNRNMIILIILIIVLLLSFLFINKTLKKKETILEEVKLQENTIKNDGFALMLEQSDGTYKESDSSSWPTDMVFNSELSGCIDTDGNKIENALSYNDTNKLVTLQTNKTSYCYIFFDKILLSSVYEQVISDYENNNGVKLLNDSDKGNRDYDTYYYTGSIANNNILYADHCWKMVITTEGNGVKIIYNGVPTNGSCNNTGDATTIGTGGFNNDDNSLAYAGYMYNKVYTFVQKTYSFDTMYTYGKSVNWDGSNYILTDTVTTKYWSAYYHYTCLGGETCSNVCYMYDGISEYVSCIILTNGEKIEDALNEMLYADDVNKIDSTIKSKIDFWYESNVLNTIDNYGNKYSNYLQNTIYCNNREITEYYGFDSNGSEVGGVEFNYDSLDCSNKNDQFTLRVDAGGEEGYGNNALKYPIGLLNYKEAKLATAYEYDDSYYYFWLLSPNRLMNNFLFGWSSEFSSYNDIASSAGIRPVVSLSFNVKIASGNGSYTNPYQLKLG